MPPPLIAITMGDPAGIGPEIIVRAFGEDKIFVQCRPLVLGDEAILSYTNHWMKAPLIIRKITEPDKGEFKPGILNLIPLTEFSPDEIVMGRPQRKGGEAAYRYVREGIKMALAGSVDALVTAPLNKEALNAAGHRFPGHTELLAAMTGVEDQVMMLAGPRLRVVLVTTHLPLREVPTALTSERIKKTIVTTFQWLQRYMGVKDPKLAVAALNPHAGEGGLFGSEEQEIIAPAIEECHQEGIALDGPLPPDSLFFHAASGKYDAVVSMYHDEGLIPFKLLHFRDGVNITLGLPIIRTSVAHGTGYDIAGQGAADPTSLMNAILMASKMVLAKKGGA